MEIWPKYVAQPLNCQLRTPLDRVKSAMNITSSSYMWLFNFLDEKPDDATMQANIGMAPKNMSEQNILKSLTGKRESKLVY